MEMRAYARVKEAVELPDSSEESLTRMGVAESDITLVMGFRERQYLDEQRRRARAEAYSEG